ncbi:hypothetical protein [Streptacidiphilus sp. EB129]|uniref:hypothetical protein n=1 Tax=Streptacidiphilus sp. EB129 TaxID=3156262 RepID=UPI003517653F
MSDQLQPLADALGTARYPYSVRRWIDRLPSAKLLARLVSEHGEIRHEHVDALPQDRITDYVREMLVTTGVLPRRHEPLARLQLWLKDTLDQLPPQHRRIIGPFAEWHVVRDARRRAARGRYTTGAASADRTDIRVAVEFLAWLDTQGHDLASTTQQVLDLWATSYPTRRAGLHSFLNWTVARRLTGKITLDRAAVAFPSRFLSEADQLEQLKRCLNDDSLPLPARIVGALTRLYGLSTTRIVALTCDRFHRDEHGAYLTVERNPVLLPPKLARLVELQMNGLGSRSVLHESSDGIRYLLPGRPASRPQNPGSIHNLLRRNGLPTISARNTAMIDVVSELPPIVVSDLFGLHPSTAHRWAKYAQSSWADYLAAHDITRP